MIFLPNQVTETKEIDMYKAEFNKNGTMKCSFECTGYHYMNVHRTDINCPFCMSAIPVSTRIEKIDGIPLLIDIHIGIQK